MNRIPCENQAECPQQTCRTDIHHLYWPASEYTGYIACHFRNIEDNKVEICRQQHIDLHKNQQPPDKPSTEFMAGYLIASEHKIGISAVKRIRRELRNARRTETR